MIDSKIKVVWAVAGLLLISGVAFGDEKTSSDATEAVAKQSDKQAVVVITDPEIAAVEEEEPDCE